MRLDYEEALALIDKDSREGLKRICTLADSIYDDYAKGL